MSFTVENIPEESLMPRYVSYDLSINGIEPWGLGDSTRWIFSSTTVQPDITAYELAQILQMQFNIADGFMGEIKKTPALLRHFRHNTDVTEPRS